MSDPLELLQLGSGRKVPFIAQGETSECALACLAMVAGYHGYETDLAALRQRHSLSLKGASLGQVLQIAEDLDLTARPLRAEIEGLDHLALPAILHWDLNHFVVLAGIREGVRGKRYRIHDPGSAVQDVTIETLSRHFTGVVVEIGKAEGFTPRVERRKLAISQLWSRMSGLWENLSKILLLSLILQLVSLAVPFFLQVSIDTVAPSADRDLLAVLAAGFAGLAIISFLTSWLRSLILMTLSNSLAYQMVANLFRQLMRLPLDWFEKRHVGDIISRFGSTQPISQLLSQGMIAAFLDGAMTLLTLVLMFVYSPILASVAIVTLVLYVTVRLSFFQALKMLNVDAITTSARENSAFIESIRGIAAIKAFGQEANRQQSWQRAKADAVNAQIKLGRLTSKFDAIGQFLFGLERVLFVYLAIRMTLDAQLTVGMIFAFQSYKQQFLDAGMRVVEQAVNYRLVQVHLGRMSDIVLSRPEGAGTQTLAGLPDFSKSFELRQVAYRYGSGEAEVFSGINLRIAPGELVAITGPSGGGKTTLMKIMMGLFEPTSGDVLVGGVPLSRFDKRKSRQLIGSVAQDGSLFAGSLAQNIAFFDPELDMEKVRLAARRACVLAEIEAMPMGFDTMVGDMGSALSGGQKQRVLLARALYSEPKILFIDEGTAHLDPQSEEAVLEGLSQLGITRIVIAHRSRAVAVADRVLLISKGQLYEGKRTEKSDQPQVASV